MKTVVVAACLLASLLASWAQGPVIVDLRFEGDEFVVEHEVREDSYYILNEIELDTDEEEGRDVKLGDPTKRKLVDGDPPVDRGFYRVHQVSKDTPRDTDGDGIDDVHELEQEALDPLNPSDAEQRGPSGRSHLAEYLADASNRRLYPHLVGVGMHDVTGPAAEGGMMGYADSNQKSEGIHDRQWARAFIAGGRDDGDKRVVFVVVDNGQVFHSVTQGVHRRLQADEELATHYSYKNIVLSATHTHGAAAGHSHHVLYNASIGGYAWQTYDALVHGIFMAIKKAHEDLAPGNITISKGMLDNANENRRPEAFMQNVEHQHPDKLGNPYGEDNRDTEMLVLRFEHVGREGIGMFNWFPVHGVSVSKENKLLTGDNKGRAAYLFEQAKGRRYPGHSDTFAVEGAFVAGFANSNPGDLTANLRNTESDWPANGEDDYGRADTIGTRQYAKAMDLYEDSAGEAVRIYGDVDFRHIYIDMSLIPVDPPSLYPYNVPGVGFPGPAENPPWGTAPGALGAEFAKGTLDGEALSQEDINLFKVNNGIVVDPITDELERRHHPKEIILTTAGIALEDMTWTAQVLPVSIIKIGDLAILSVPAEFTVMAGWRLRKTVEAILGPDTHTIVAGLSNAYSGYVTTYEEYTFQTNEEGVLNQGYEAASTQFGPYTLAAYQTKFAELAQGLADGTEVTSIDFNGLEVAMPETKEPELFLLKAADPIIDAEPLPQAFPAVYKDDAGCEEGEFYDTLSGYCWSCPEDYSDNLLQLNKAADDACVNPASSQFSKATRHGLAGCGVGQFFDTLSGACWSCPTGYNDNLLQLNKAANDACHRPASSSFKAALSAAGTGFFGTDCSTGYVYDFTLGRCYKCPSEHNKVIFRGWNHARACEKVTPAAWTKATRHDGLCPDGQFWDVGTGFCWSCPSGDARTIFPVDGDAACEKVIPATYTKATAGKLFHCDVRGDEFGEEWFLDIGRGECWSCEGRGIRNLNPVTSPEACTGGNVSFGDLVSDPAWFTGTPRTFNQGDVVSVSFWGGHPKNVFGTKSNRLVDQHQTFLKVQKQVGNGAWRTIRTDADWDTTFSWERVGIASSKATIRWLVTEGSGTYRLVHDGYSLAIDGVSEYQGESPAFTVN